MPTSLARGRRRVSILQTKPADIKAATKAEADAGLFASCRIIEGTYNLNPGTSETIEEGSLCTEITPKTMTNGTWADAELTIWRYFDSSKPGQHEASSGDEIGDAIFQALKERGTRVWIMDRFTAKRATDPWEAGDEYRIFEVQTDAWSFAESEGYIKVTIPLVVADGYLNGVVAAGAA